MKLLALRGANVSPQAVRDSVSSFVAAVRDGSASGVTIVGREDLDDPIAWLKNGAQELSLVACEILAIDQLMPAERDGFTGRPWSDDELCVAATVRHDAAAIGWGLVLVRQKGQLTVRALFNPLPLLLWSKRRAG